MRKTRACCLLAGLYAAGLSAAVAQLDLGGSLLDNCAEIDALQQAGNFGQAREKARLCLQGIEEQLEGQVGAHFLEEVAGWTRVRFEQNSAMGITNISADYTKDDFRATVALTGGNSLGGVFSGLAQIGALQGGREVQVGGLPAMIMPDGTVLVTLDDGSHLNFSSASFDDPDSTIEGMGDLIDQFPVAEINATLSDD